MFPVNVDHKNTFVVQPGKKYILALEGKQRWAWRVLSVCFVDPRRPLARSNDARGARAETAATVHMH